MEITVHNGEMTDAEIQEYVKYAKEKHETNEDKVVKLDIYLDGEFVDLKVETAPVKFQRIRRITGYLVGTLDRFNDGKKAEEHDRVKHTISNEYEPHDYSGLIDE